MQDLGWRRRWGSCPAARRGARQRAGLTPASASNTLSCLLEMLHSKQLRSIKMLVDSNHGIYRDHDLADLWLLITPTERRADCVQPHVCATSTQAILKSLGWRFCSMAKLVFGMNQSLDGYVDHLEMRTSTQHAHPS